MYFDLEVVFFVLGAVWIGLSSSVGIWLMNNKIYSKLISYCICLFYFVGIFIVAYYLGQINKQHSIEDGVKYIALLSLIVFFCIGVIGSRRIWKK